MGRAGHIFQEGGLIGLSTGEVVCVAGEWGQRKERGIRDRQEPDSGVVQVVVKGLDFILSAMKSHWWILTGKRHDWNGILTRSFWICGEQREQCKKLPGNQSGKTLHRGLGEEEWCLRVGCASRGGGKCTAFRYILRLCTTQGQGQGQI